jgi:hypothetical protein
LGKDAHESTGHAFGPRHLRPKAVGTGDGNADSNRPQGVSGRNMEIVEARRANVASSGASKPAREWSSIVREAEAKRQIFSHEQAAQVKRRRLEKAELLKTSSEQLAGLATSWSLVGGARAQAGSFESEHAVIPVLACRFHDKRFSHQAYSFSNLLSLPAATAEWDSMHHVVRHDECPSLGKIPMNDWPCFAAGRCIHEGEGLTLRRWKTELQRLTLQARKAVGEKAFKYYLVGGGLVLRVSLEPGAKDDPVSHSTTLEGRWHPPSCA